MNEHENARLQAAKDAMADALAAMDRIGDPAITPGMVLASVTRDGHTITGSVVEWGLPIIIEDGESRSPWIVVEWTDGKRTRYRLEREEVTP